MIFWNHVVVTCVPYTCIGWPQMTFFELQIFGGFQNLINLCQNVPDFIPGAIFGKNVEKNYKISCSGNGNPPQRWRKTWKWCQFLLIFECHDCSVSFRSFALGSREVTWTTSDLISRDWRRIQFWKCSIFAFLRKIVKDEIEKLQNWIKFITKRFDPFWNIQKHPKWIFSAHSRQFGSVQKILEILKIWKLGNSFKMIQWGWRIQVYFSWLSILKNIWVWNLKNVWLKWDSNPRPRRDWSLNPTP